jgi:hypothetical protein
MISLNYGNSVKACTTLSNSTVKVEKGFILSFRNEADNCFDFDHFCMWPERPG